MLSERMRTPMAESRMTAIERGQVELDERAGRLQGNGSAPTTPVRFVFLTAVELLEQPPILWRVLHVIPERGLILLWGASGSGKTFIAFDIAASVVRGIPWAGRRTKHGSVVYIATEGTLKLRAQAYLTHHSLTAAPLMGCTFCRAGWTCSTGRRLRS